MRVSRFSKQLTIALPLEHFAEVKQITDREKISMAEWVRDVVAEALSVKREEEKMDE